VEELDNRELLDAGLRYLSVYTCGPSYRFVVDNFEVKSFVGFETGYSRGKPVIGNIGIW
jgi:hypothetical protein